MASVTSVCTPSHAILYHKFSYQKLKLWPTKWQARFIL